MSELTYAQARELADAAMAEARRLFGRPICVAVSDASGLLLAFARMDGAPLRSVAIAQGKAYSAARMGATTQAVLERLQREGIEIGYFCDPQLTALPGGAPLKDRSGALCGAIGVSGLAAAEDQQVCDLIAARYAA
jgi:uncharacterized protein GlcG (DUF336 family)